MEALFHAAKQNHRSIVNLLLDEGFDWSFANNKDETALHAASWEGNTEVVSALLKTAYESSDYRKFKRFLDYRNSQGKTALLDAAPKIRIEVAKILVEYNADFLIVSKDECSALSFSCWEGHTEMVAYLVRVAFTKLSKERFRSFLNHRNKWGKTVFADAAEKGRLQIVELLREQQYDADYQLANNEGITPLHYASWNGHKEVVAFILKTAFENSTSEKFRNFINLRNNRGKTALMDAAEKNRADVIHVLLDYEADYSIGDRSEFTALHFGALHSQTAAVHALLERTSQDEIDQGGKFQRFLNQQSRDTRTTALHDAAIQRHTEVANCILGYGPAYDPVDSGKRTAMHHAVEGWDVDFAIALFKYAEGDADRERFRHFINAKEENGNTVWATANRRGLQGVIENLKANEVVERT